MLLVACRMLHSSTFWFLCFTECTVLLNLDEFKVLFCLYTSTKHNVTFIWQLFITCLAFWYWWEILICNKMAKKQPITTGFGRNNSHIWRGHCSVCGGATVMGGVSLVSCGLAFSDNAMGWSGEHRGFVVETFFKNNKSVIATQRAFRRHFRLGRRAPIPDRRTILLWVSNENHLADLGALELLKMFRPWGHQSSSLQGVPQGNTPLPLGFPIEVWEECCTGNSECIPAKWC